MHRHRILLQSLLILLAVWGIVAAVRAYAGSKRITAEKVAAEVNSAAFEDWSESPGDSATAKKREEKIRTIAGLVNRLDFNERERNRDDRSVENLFRRLSGDEKKLFIDLTVRESMSKFMEALDALPPAERKKFVEKGLSEISSGRTEEEMALVLRHKPPIVITALGSPAAIVEAVQSYGGVVLADVNSVLHARKAVAAGVDGLVLVAAGAGGHTGPLSAFAFVPAVREFFDGIIVLGGAIGTGRAIRAAEVLGADFAYLGTRLIATEESIADPDYKAMVVEATVDDIVLSASLTGIPANWLKASLVAAGHDPAAMGPRAQIELGRPETTGAKRWKDVWSAGQGVDAVKAVERIDAVVDALERDYRALA
jgi:nitronate monooxygenase